MKAKKQQHGVPAGFTLLELILVMVILTIVLAMSGPSLRGFFASRKAKDTAAHILAFTQYARSQAVCEGIIYRLNFDLDERLLWLTSWQSGDFRRLTNDFGKVFELPTDLDIELINLEEDRETHNIFLKFTPQGTVTPGTVRLMDAGDRAIEVMCPTMTEPFTIVEINKDRVTSRTNNVPGRTWKTK